MKHLRISVHERKAQEKSKTTKKDVFASLVVSNQQIITAKELISKAYAKTNHAKHYQR